MRALGGISAISEGWALYAERMVAQEGWYEGDLEGLLGNWMTSCSGRDDWSSILDCTRCAGRGSGDRLRHRTQRGRTLRRIRTGLFCKIGQLEIFRLRDKARTALGQRFSIKEFHNVVLSAGSVPPTVLEREVDAYIALKKAA